MRNRFVYSPWEPWLDAALTWLVLVAVGALVVLIVPQLIARWGGLT